MSGKWFGTGDVKAILNVSTSVAYNFINRFGESTGSRYVISEWKLYDMIESGAAKEWLDAWNYRHTVLSHAGRRIMEEHNNEREKTPETT